MRRLSGASKSFLLLPALVMCSSSYSRGAELIQNGSLS